MNPDSSASMRRRLVASALLLCSLVTGGLSWASAESYSYTSLGTLGGSGSWAYDINNAGQVAGRSNTTDNSAVHATLWSGEAMTDLGALGGYANSIAYGINDAGSVVGRSVGTAGFVGTLWRDGIVLDLGLGINSTANAINNAGMVAATRLSGSPGQMATWTDGVISHRFQTSFLRPGINDAGQVVGESGNQAVLWSGGTATPLGTMPGAVSSYAFAINASGQVVGDSVFCGACNDRATLWQDGHAIDLGTLGGSDSVAVDINATGLIVGSSKTTGGDYHATLWTDGAIVDLNSHLDAVTADAGWVLVEANAINDAGWIVGGAINTFNMKSSAFLLTPVSPFLRVATPVPEPGITVLFAAGLGLLVWVQRRRSGQAAAR